MGQFVGCVSRRGRTALEFPVISGNVSLYNETNGEAIPTPVIGGVGLIEDIDATVGIGIPAPNHSIVLIGETDGWLGVSSSKGTFSRRRGRTTADRSGSERRTEIWFARKFNPVPSLPATICRMAVSSWVSQRWRLRVIAV